MEKLPAVLMVAYYFPPMGGAGVQRTHKFVKYLPQYGWQPHILTVRARGIPADPSLLAELPAENLITRTSYLGLPSRLPWRVRNFIARWLLLVDEQIGWLPFATNAGRKLIEKGNGIQVIYSTSAPYTAHLVARQLHRQFQLPWVADFRDPWLENPLIKFPTALHRQINEHFEQSVFSEAERVILNTEMAQDRYRRKYRTLPPGRMVTIPNGYDQDDELMDHQSPAGSVFTLVHIGSLYRKTRSSEFFLRALHKALQDGKIPADNIKVRFIGSTDKETQVLIERFNLRGKVELLGYLPHRKAMEEMYLSDLLLLIPSYGVGAELFIPAKIYEYLAVKKPILCMAEPGACADLVLKARAGSVVPPTDVDKIADKLFEIYQSWENGQLLIKPDMGFISSFERRKLTGQLANLLNEICV